VRKLIFTIVLQKIKIKIWVPASVLPYNYGVIYSSKCVQYTFKNLKVPQAKTDDLTGVWQE
jgi:hypothetical protein